VRELSDFWRKLTFKAKEMFRTMENDIEDRFTFKLSTRIAGGRRTVVKDCGTLES